MEEIFEQIEKLEEIEEKSRDKLIDLLYDVELEISYDYLEEIAKKIQREEGISEEEALLRAKFLLNSLPEDEDEIENTQNDNNLRGEDEFEDDDWL